ncbi:MAG: hypothetical protein JWR44_222 [Hymenobacter sp.]|jgi:DNA invertase Pin-like site-specific DNA recombinase|nr:hypothetical protein [Hymenobacter sp.]
MPESRPATRAKTRSQIRQFRDFAVKHGTFYKVYTDQESGGKADRTEFRTLLLEAYQNKFDLVVFWRLDHFSREGALAARRYLTELKDHGVNRLKRSAMVRMGAHQACRHQA